MRWLVSLLAITGVLVLASATIGNLHAQTINISDPVVADETLLSDDTDADDLSDVYWYEAAPLWRASFGALLLQREDPESQPFLGDGNLAPLLNASQVDFDHSVGWDLYLERRLDECTSVEARWFDDGTSNASLSLESATGITLIYAGGAAGLGTFTTPAVGIVDYDSSLSSVELNLRRRASDNLTLIAGARYVHLDETLRVSLSQGGPFFDQISETTNDLIGGQVGADLVLVDRDCFQLHAIGKFGVCHNTASNEVRVVGGFATRSGVGDDVTSYVGDLSLLGTYQVNACWSLCGGVQMFWMDEVAVAITQPYANPATFPQTVIDTNSNLFYYGLTLGVQRVF